MNYIGRRKGMTLAFCQMAQAQLKEGKNIFIAGETYPSNYVSIFKSLGIEVNVEESYTTQRLEPIYHDLFAIEPNIIGFSQKPKKLTGYILTLKQ